MTSWVCSSFAARAICEQSIQPLISIQYRAYATRAPKVRNATTNRSSFRTSPYKWPQDFIVNAQKDDRLPRRFTQPYLYSNFLDTFVALYKPKQSKQVIQKLLDDFEIKPSTLTSLSQVLIRADTSTADDQFLRVAISLLDAASKLDDEAASITLTMRAIEHRSTNYAVAKEAFEKVQQLAASGSGRAMLVMAKKYESEGDVEEAVKMAQLATSNPFPPLCTPSTTLSDQLDAKEAFLVAARLKRRNGDRVAAKAMLERAINDYDSSEACYELAKDYLTPGNGKYIGYMLKAATSGVQDAAVRVAQWAFQKAESISTKPPETSIYTNRNSKYHGLRLNQDSMLYYLYAQEWFRVVVACNKKLSIGTDTAVQYILICAAMRKTIAKTCGDLIHDLKDSNSADLVLHDIKKIRNQADNAEAIEQITKSLRANLKIALKN